MSEVDSAEERLSGLALSGVAYPVGTFALTPLQSGMLFHQIQGGEAERGVDLEQLVCRTSEKIDFEAFARAVGALVKGYPILRTQFAWKSGGEPTQEVIAGSEPSVALFERCFTIEPVSPLSHRYS